MLDRLGNEMETIQEGVQGLVVMEDSLKGEGETQFVHFTWTATCHSFSVSSYFRTVSQTLPPYDGEITFEGMRKVVGGNGPGTPDGLAPYAVGAFDFFTEDIGTMLSADATENERFEAALFTFIKPAKMYDTAHDALKTGEKAKDAEKGIVNPNRLIPGKPGVVTGGDSTKSGKNMVEEMGLKRSTKWRGYQAQHIIPSEMAKNPVIKKME